MPVKQAGSLIPQLAVAGRIRAFRLRKWFWTAAGGVQSVCLLLMAVVAVSAPPDLAGAAVVAFRVLCRRGAALVYGIPYVVFLGQLNFSAGFRRKLRTVRLNW